MCGTWGMEEEELVGVGVGNGGGVGRGGGGGGGGIWDADNRSPTPNQANLKPHQRREGACSPTESGTAYVRPAVQRRPILGVYVYRWRC